MANTWQVIWTDASYADNPLCSILNGGARVIKIRRIGIVNTNSVGHTPTGLQKTTLNFYDATASLAAPNVLIPREYDTTNSALSSVTIGRNGTPSTTGSGPFALRSWMQNCDSVIPTGDAFLIDWLVCVPLGIVWDAGYGNSEVQPLTLRTDEMVCLTNASNGGDGTQSGWIEFTDEA